MRINKQKMKSTRRTRKGHEFGYFHFIFSPFLNATSLVFTSIMDYLSMPYHSITNRDIYYSNSYACITVAYHSITIKIMCALC